MKKLFKTMSAAAVGILSCAILAATAYAEDYTFDVSGASESGGKWGQSFICYTALGNEEYSENFNPMWMTSDSEVIVDYTYTGEANGSPVELIWQTWGDGPVKPNPDVTKDWNKIAPYEYTDTEAKFSFSDIAASYGSDNFDTVYAICVGDTGVNLTVTGMKVTNCNITAPVQTEETAAEAETEAQTEEETEAETEEATEAEPKPKLRKRTRLRSKKLQSRKRPRPKLRKLPRQRQPQLPKPLSRRPQQRRPPLPSLPDPMRQRSQQTHPMATA